MGFLTRKKTPREFLRDGFRRGDWSRTTESGFSKTAKGLVGALSATAAVIEVADALEAQKNVLREAAAAEKDVEPTPPMKDDDD